MHHILLDKVDGRSQRIVLYRSRKIDGTSQKMAAAVGGIELIRAWYGAFYLENDGRFAGFRQYALFLNGGGPYLVLCCELIAVVYILMQKGRVSVQRLVGDLNISVYIGVMNEDPVFASRFEGVGKDLGPS